MPARKKHPSARARANKAATAAQLTVRQVGDYTDLTVAQLRAEIRRRNGDGRVEQLAATGAKSVLVDRLRDDDLAVPPLPDRPEGWHPQTRLMWADIWSSPMSEEWDDSDLHNVLILALVHDDMWTAETPKERKDAAGEYRLQRVDLGLSPYARRRLEWTIETAAEAKDRGKKRQARATDQTDTGAPPAPPARDPRLALVE